jgi:hypothetical protein
MFTTHWRYANAFAASLAAAMLLAGCGSSADPREVADVASRFTSSANPVALGMPGWQAKCRAEVFLESDLSRKALASVRAGHEPQISSPRDAKVMHELADTLAEKCLERDG